jgi:hypothetical protein
VIDVMVDGGEHYIYVKFHNPIGRHEGMVFKSNKSGHHYIASSIRLCRYMLSLCGCEDKVKLCCGEPINIDYYGIALPIITKNILER